MPTSRRIAALLTAAALALPATAAAQTTTVPRGGSGVSTTPPVPLRDRDRPRETARALPAPAAGELPDTGADPRLLFLCGVALTLVGAGLRLRTADAELF